MLSSNFAKKMLVVFYFLAKRLFFNFFFSLVIKYQGLKLKRVGCINKLLAKISCC